MVEAALRAIADPRRQDILTLVHQSELSAGEIASRFDVTRPAISQHLKVLVDTGLVSMRRDGTRRLYTSRPEGLDEIRAFLDRFWGRRLDLLKQVVEQEQRGDADEQHADRTGRARGQDFGEPGDDLSVPDRP